MVFVALCLLAVRAGMDSTEDEPWYNDAAARRVSKPQPNISHQSLGTDNNCSTTTQSTLSAL